MGLKRFDKPVILLVLGLFLSYLLSLSGSSAPVVADATNPFSNVPGTLPALNIQSSEATPTEAAALSENARSTTTSTSTSTTTTSTTAPLTATPGPAASLTEAAGSPVQPQPLPDGPLALIRLKLTTRNLKLVDQLLGLEPVKAGRLIPIDYLSASAEQPEQLLALSPAAEASLYSTVAGLNYTLLDSEADTARYFYVKLPSEVAPQGQTWLDSAWKVLDQTGNRVYFKAALPLFLGWGFRDKLLVQKAPPRIQLPGLTKPCPCPALAEATFAGMALAAQPTTPRLSTEELKARLSLVTETRLRQVVDQIVKNEVRGQGALNKRYTGTGGSLYAAERLYNYFFALGLKVDYDSFLEGGLGTVASNVVAEQLPSDPAQNSKPVILMAHYDSLGERNLSGFADPKIPAYGANDNGVGLAGLLEIARLLNGFQFANPIRYIAFGAEEQGMLGSQDYTRYSIKPASSKAALNIDSFGYNPGAEDWVILGYLAHGEQLKDSMIAYRDKYQINLRLEVKQGEPFFRSDDYYFDQTDHAAVVLTDSYNLQSPNNHTANDTLANVNFTTTRKVIQLALVTVAEQAGLGGLAGSAG